MKHDAGCDDIGTLQDSSPQAAVAQIGWVFDDKDLDIALKIITKCNPNMH